MKRKEREIAGRSFDGDVLRLVKAGYLDSEICEALDLPEEALKAALDRLADWLAPTAASGRSVDLSDCLPFEEHYFHPPGTRRGRRDVSTALGDLNLRSKRRRE